MIPPRRRRSCLIFLFLTVALGLAWRTAPLHLTPFLFKYGGSVLWAIALYLFIAVLLPRLGPVRLAIFAALIAALLELSRLWHLPTLDAFRVTLPGRLLLGRFFSLKNIAAYWLAIGLAALIDDILFRKDRTTHLR